MKRKIYRQLLEWKGNGNCALLLDGARRVGKSYIAEQFGKNEYVFIRLFCPVNQCLERRDG